MVYCKNKENTVRVTKYFNDRIGVYEYYLEKYITPVYIFGIKIISGRWSNGSAIKCRIPPVKTCDVNTVNRWIEHYQMNKPVVL